MAVKKIRVLFLLSLFVSGGGILLSQEPEAFRYSPDILPLAGGSTSALLPEDHELGPLKDGSAMGGERRRVIERTRDFFSFLKGGRVASEFFDSEAKEALSIDLKEKHDFTDMVIKEVRYGEVELLRRADGSVSARVDVRLFFESSSTLGEVFYLLKRGDWKISAVNIAVTENYDKVMEGGSRWDNKSAE